ncbi:MAG: hypothetical protein K9J06_02805 [Flavobacteriales bacterium]|nr:hypothetical protein [Flavobacteriales bacterium]
MKLLLTIAFALSLQSAVAQRMVDWSTLANVTFTREFSKQFGFEVNVKPPRFAPEILALHGQTVRVRGYVIPVDMELGLYMVSANPFANCFFCGGAGPETVVELFGAEKFPRFNTDQVVTFQGKFQVSTGGEMGGVPYQLFQARMVK